ncbi:MAG: hypothetical protein ACK559_10615, partial [bacterium]
MLARPPAQVGDPEPRPPLRPVRLRVQSDHDRPAADVRGQLEVVRGHDDAGARLNRHHALTSERPVLHTAGRDRESKHGVVAAPVDVVEPDHGQALSEERDQRLPPLLLLRREGARDRRRPPGHVRDHLGEQALSGAGGRGLDHGHG